MSETLIGVIIGGLLGSMSPLIALLYQHKRWKSEKKLEYLRERRAQLEDLFKNAQKEIGKGIEDGTYSTTFWSEIEFLYPEPVAEALNKMMTEKEKTLDNMKLHYYRVNRVMNNELAKLDEQIEELVN